MEKFTATLTVAFDAPPGNTEKLRKALDARIAAFMRNNMETIAASVNGRLRFLGGRRRFGFALASAGRLMAFSNLDRPVKIY